MNAATEGSALNSVLARWPDSDLPRGSAGAAVTIVLREGRSGSEVLLIERTVREDDPASGQVALPGGHAEDGDSTMRATALRELREEVGLGEADVTHPLRFVGVQHANVFGLDVAVYATALTNRPGPVVASPGEVAHVFWLPSESLGTVRSVERTTRRGTMEVPAVVHQGHVLWGFTLRVLRDAFGLPPPPNPSAPYR